MDHDPVDSLPSWSAAGLEPIVEQTAHAMIEQHVALAVRKALAGRVDTTELEDLAAGAAERALGELADPPGLYYQTVDEWVEDWLLPVYRRPVQGHERTWCPQWWRHPEAVARLESLWRAWEHLRQDPATGLSVWFRDHADHHMTILLDADGPFKGCGDGRHSQRALEPLSADPAPEGLFEPNDERPAGRTNGLAAVRQPHRPSGGYDRDSGLRQAR